MSEGSAAAVDVAGDATGDVASPTIVFSHGNGFPAGTYRQLLEPWRQADCRVLALEKFGHDPARPVTSNWPYLRDELIHHIERAAAGPVFLVGHSLGGYLSLLAASHRPDLARGVVLLDSPILGGWKARVLQMAKATGIGERLSPGFVSRRRREQWPSAEAAHGHFAAKAAFARWAPGVLHDYITAGTEAGGGQQRLSFDRRIETDIYNTLPHHLTRLLRTRPLACPLAFIGGSESVEVRRVGLRATERLTQGRIRWIPGSHLFPMERPADTAQAVMVELREFGMLLPGD